MWHLESALYVRIEEVRHGLQPLPWELGFQADRAYRMLGFFHPAISGQPQVLLRSECGQEGFIPMCHLQAVACVRHFTQDSVPLSALQPDDSVCLSDWVYRGSSMGLMQHQALALP